MLSLEGEPVIRHTIQRALEADCFDQVYCITDSPLIQDAVNDLPCQVIQSPSAANGTERIAKSLNYIPSPYIVNLQGDEPLFPPEELAFFANNFLEQTELLHILIRMEQDPQILANPNRVKVQISPDQHVQAFTRAYTSNLVGHDSPTKHSWGTQLGIYGYSKALLREYLSLPSSPDEKSLSHEILRWDPLPPIFAQITQSHPISLDTEEDWKAIQNFAK